MNVVEVMRRVQSMRHRLERPPGLDPLDTQNKKLESLRRVRKSQMEEVEERQLREDIRAYNKKKTTRSLVGDTPLQNTSFRLKRPPKQGMFAGRGSL